MKNLVIAMLIASSLFAQAQEQEEENITIYIYQDAALALFKDNHGNKPFTTDLRFKMKWNGFNDNTYGFLTITSLFEYANLNDDWKGKFYRYGVEIGYTFSYCRVFNIPFMLNPSVGFASIHRELIDTHGALSLELSIEATIKLSSRLRLSGLITAMQRPDLENKAASFNPIHWKPNGYIGLGYRIF